MSLLERVRWESIVPYADGFIGHHHPEVPGGQIFLTSASTPGNPTRHWIALQAGATLDVLDNPVNGCWWTATAVGVSFRELLPYEASDLAELRSPGNTAAAGAARAAAGLWDRMDQQRKRWFVTAFPRSDPRTVWCSPQELPPWTEPSRGVLYLSTDWRYRYEKCRWAIPRRGFWEWQLKVEYTSEQGHRHTEVLASDLSWFREPNDYLNERVTIW